MKLFSLLLPALLSLALTCAPERAAAHPIPDIPVRSFFDAGGETRIEVEVDVRCFADDAENEPYLLKWVLERMTDEEKADLKKQATALVSKSVALNFAPGDTPAPEFEWTFTTHRGESLEEETDPVMLTGVWKTRIAPKDGSTYQVNALPEGQFSVLFLNHINDVAVPRFQVLFPGEKSYELDLSEVAPAKKTAAVTTSAR